MNSVVKRLKAFLIDYCFILLYVACLAGFTFLISALLSLSLKTVDPVTAQAIGFFSLTLPVILYFTVSEHSKHGGTIGKRKLHLQVVSRNYSRPGFWQLLVRNVLKFLPWELAHFFIYHLVDSNRNGIEPPVWIKVGLIISPAIALVYLGCLFSKSHRSIYEILSSTRVILPTGESQKILS